MRKFITAIAFAAIIISCGNANSKSRSFKPGNPDTTKVLAVWKVGEYYVDTVTRIIKLELKPMKDDSTRNEWVKDTAYYIPFVIDSVTKKVQWYGLSPMFAQEITLKPMISK